MRKVLSSLSSMLCYINVVRYSDPVWLKMLTWCSNMPLNSPKYFFGNLWFSLSHSSPYTFGDGIQETLFSFSHLLPRTAAAWGSSTMKNLVVQAVSCILHVILQTCMISTYEPRLGRLAWRSETECLCLPFFWRWNYRSPRSPLKRWDILLDDGCRARRRRRADRLRRQYPLLLLLHLRRVRCRSGVARACIRCAPVSLLILLGTLRAIPVAVITRAHTTLRYSWSVELQRRSSFLRGYLLLVLCRRSKMSFDRAPQPFREYSAMVSASDAPGWRRQVRRWRRFKKRPAFSRAPWTWPYRSADNCIFCCLLSKRLRISSRNFSQVTVNCLQAQQLAMVLFSARLAVGTKTCTCSCKQQKHEFF